MNKLIEVLAQLMSATTSSQIFQAWQELKRLVGLDETSFITKELATAQLRKYLEMHPTLQEMFGDEDKAFFQG